MQHIFMKFQEMTDSQRNTVAPHLPKPAATGRPRSDDRTSVNAVMSVLITGCRRVGLPARYGSKSSAHRRFQDPQKKGVWKKILSEPIKTGHKQGKISLKKYPLTPHQHATKKGQRDRI